MSDKALLEGKALSAQEYSLGFQVDYYFDCFSRKNQKNKSPGDSYDFQGIGNFLLAVDGARISSTL